MIRLSILSIWMVALLAACGQVIVFGHVVGEHPAASEPKPANPSATAAQTAPAAPAESTPRVNTQPAAVSPTLLHTVKAIDLVVTPEAAARATGDAARFTVDALLDAIRTELRSRKLLDEQDPHAGGTAEIVVDGLATRPTSNAILFGYKMLAGTLEGDIRVKGADGKESTGTRIVAESKLTLAVAGDDKNPLGPLYRRFAVLAGDRLAGIETKPQESSGAAR